MKKITISDLCNQASTIIDQVFAGEHLTVTRDGHAVVELNPIPREPIEVAALLERWRATILIRPLQDGTPIDRI